MASEQFERTVASSVVYRVFARVLACLRQSGLVCLVVVECGTVALADDLDSKRTKMKELADLLAQSPGYFAEVPPLSEFAGVWGLSERDCQNADEVEFRILHLAPETLRVDDLVCTFIDTTRHDSGLALIVEADCVSSDERETEVFALTMLPVGQISIFQRQTGTNYLRCE
jgi:hypothetical protein